jgi:hypothetical protein
MGSMDVCGIVGQGFRRGHKPVGGYSGNGQKVGYARARLISGNVPQTLI